MRHYTFTLSKSEDTYSFKESVIRAYLPGTILKIILIEIQGIDSPLEISLDFKDEGLTKRLEFLKHRTQFLFQNGAFILDTSKMNLEIDLAKTQDFYMHPAFIKINSEKDFQAKVVCSSNQPAEKYGIEYL